MALSVQELKRWINTLSDDNAIAIDDDDLSLVEIDATGATTGAYYEVGGIPDADEDDDEDDER